MISWLEFVNEELGEMSLVSGAGELSFLDKLNDALAGPDDELKVPEEVESQKTVHATLCGQIMAQDLQVGHLLPNSSGRPYGYARGIFNAAAGDDTLALKQGVSRVISKLDQDLCGNNRKAGSSVKDDRNENRRRAIRRLKEKINDKG